MEPNSINYRQLYEPSSTRTPASTPPLSPRKKTNFKIERSGDDKSPIKSDEKTRSVSRKLEYLGLTDNWTPKAIKHILPAVDNNDSKLVRVIGIFNSIYKFSQEYASELESLACQNNTIYKSREETGWPFGIVITNAGAIYALTQERFGCFDAQFKQMTWAINLDRGQVVAHAELNLTEEIRLKKAREEILFQNKFGGAYIPKLLHSYSISLIQQNIPTVKQCLIMEYCQLGDLNDYLYEDVAMEPTEPIWQIYKDVLQAVILLHQNGVVHRDIKLANILVNKDTDGKIRGKLADLGLAIYSQEINLTNRLAGTPDYLPPEIARFILLEQRIEERSIEIDSLKQALKTENENPEKKLSRIKQLNIKIKKLQTRRQADAVLSEKLIKTANQDIWALGIVLCEIINGNAPLTDVDSRFFMNRLAAVTQNEIESYLDESYSVTQPLNDLIKKMLSVNPTKRPTALECLEEILRLEKSQAGVNIDADFNLTGKDYMF